MTEHDTWLIGDDSQLPKNNRKTRRGEANSLRKGFSKIHRHNKPHFSGSTPRGAAAKVTARLRGHDWRRNGDMITLRQKGYTPFKRRNDPTFKPKPMRITPRSESREALTALSEAFVANCDFNPESKYPFEVICSFEQIARSMGVLHVYDSGRKAYDVALNALSVLEQLGGSEPHQKYCVVQREFDPDSGQYKPVRLWLTPRFFESRGFSLEEIRGLLNDYRNWAIKNGLSESLKKRHERHLLRMDRLGVDIERRHSLKGLLNKIKRQVVSTDLLEQKNAVVIDLGARLDAMTKRTSRSKQRTPRKYFEAFIRWETSVPAHKSLTLKMGLRNEFPGLESLDPEAFYKRLLERAGII